MAPRAAPRFPQWLQQTRSLKFADALGFRSYDPITLALTVLVLGIATLLACLLPAAGAIQINPTSVLNE